jgi:ferrochelatase
MPSSTGPDVSPYDALVLLSFGGPEKPDDVIPFLENVTRGRGIPPERLEEVGKHYFLFGGRSPINDQNRALLEAIRDDLSSNGIDLPVYWGNRNWDPYLTETMTRMRDDGITRAAVLTTSAYSSYSSCRQYREDLAAAVAQVDGAPRVDRLRQYFNHPGFIEPVVDASLTALTELSDRVRDEAALVFVTHSIPTEMARTSGPHGDAYVRQHLSAVDEVSARLRHQTGHRRSYDLVYCSRSGSPRTPWLEPDVNDHLAVLAARGTKAVVLIPIGFVSDHMEVIYDLDTEALATAQELGLEATRAATPGVDGRFVAMVRDLLVERAAAERGEDMQRQAVGTLPAWPGICAAGCCPNPRGERPALCGHDA